MSYLDYVKQRVPLIRGIKQQSLLTFDLHIPEYLILLFKHNKIAWR